MLKAENKTIKMTEGDFGLLLPITITGGQISEDETLVFYIKDDKKENLIEPKSYKNIQNNTFDLSFTEEESKLMKSGVYFYYIDWYKENEFLGNIINGKLFKVEDK